MVKLRQSAAYGVSEVQETKISWASMPPDPPRSLAPSALEFFD